MKRHITVQKTENASALLPLLDSDADGEFVNFTAQNDEDMYTISDAGTVVGLAQSVAGQPAFLYVYIFLQYRRCGFGTAAAAVLEDLLRAAQSQRVQTCFRFADRVSGRFAHRLGYRVEFASSCMIYTGAPMEGQQLPVRKYRDADFLQAHSLCAEAFHKMRLQTGCFPDSTIETPDPETEEEWNRTASQRFVYEQNGEIVGTLLLEGNEIGCVAVKCTHQKKGIGTQLVKYAVNRLLAEGQQSVSLYCVAGNPARRLYERLGFGEQYRNEYAIKAMEDYIPGSSPG